MGRIANYFILILLICLFIFKNYSHEKINSQTRISKIGEKIIDTLMINYMTHGQAPKEIQLYVSDIQRELGMENIRIRVLEMSGALIEKIGRENAVSSNIGNCIILSSSWFNSLTDAEKRMLIGHELIHIKNKHHLRIIKTALLIWFTNELIYKIEPFKTIDQQYNPHISCSVDISLGSWSYTHREHIIDILTPLWIAFFMHSMRKLEYEADKLAAQKLSCAQGGINLLKRLANLEQRDRENQTDSIMKRFNSKIYEKLYYIFFSTHPTIEKRIEKLNKL